MSADLSYDVNRVALLAKAAKVTACHTFSIEQGGSRHHCSRCDASEADHMIVALRERINERGVL